MHNVILTNKEARKFREKLAEATLQAVAYDENTPPYMRKMVKKNLALYALLKPPAVKKP